jgi:hypothetical protein
MCSFWWTKFCYFGSLNLPFGVGDFCRGIVTRFDALVRSVLQRKTWSKRATKFSQSKYWVQLITILHTVLSCGSTGAHPLTIGAALRSLSSIHESLWSTLKVYQSLGDFRVVCESFGGRSCWGDPGGGWGRLTEQHMTLAARSLQHWFHIR